MKLMDKSKRNQALYYIRYYFEACNEVVGCGGGATRPLPRDGDIKELHRDPIVGPRPKVWTKGQKWKKRCRRWRAGEARMRDSQGGGESDPAEDVRRRYMNNSPSFLSCIGKRSKEGCNRGSKVETVHSG